jgi:hypothetical protein
LDQEGIPLTFIPKPSDGGQYALVIRKYKEVRKANRSSDIRIWVDYDRYQRNDDSDMDNYKHKPTTIADFLFSYMNFEDFLSMHCDRPELERWWTSCVSRNHFSIPSHSSEYMSAFKAFIGENYEKGDIPIRINCHTLENVRMHQKDQSIPFKCDFATIFLALIEIEQGSYRELPI